MIITENSDASSANNFAFEFKQLTNGDHPLWCLPMTNVDHLTQLSVFQSSIFNEIISSPVLFCCNLKSKPLCKTLSNALDMSRETPLTSWPSSNAKRISSAIDSNYLVKESSGLNPDCFGKIRSFFEKIKNKNMLF